jgi:hypothetical protein
MIRRSALPALSALMLLLIACSGDDAPAATPTESATSGIVASSPADLASYRFSVDLRMLPRALDVSEAPAGLSLDQQLSIMIEGERQNPDREHAFTTADLVFLQVSTETIAIGEQKWLREGNRPWVEGGSSPLEAYAALGFRPSILFAEDEGRYDDLALALEQYEWDEDVIRGAPTRRFALDHAAFTELFLGEGSVLPAQINATLSAVIWLDREIGTPVRMIVNGIDEAGVEILALTIELWDFDATDIDIQPPA